MEKMHKHERLEVLSIVLKVRANDFMKTLLSKYEVFKTVHTVKQSVGEQHQKKISLD